MENFKGIWIPKEIWFIEDISITEKILLSEIKALDDGNGCRASNRHFSKLLKLSISRINSMIIDLKRDGYIKRMKSSNRKRFLSVAEYLDTDGSSICKQTVIGEYSREKKPFNKLKGIKRGKPHPSSKFLDYWNSFPNVQKHKDTNTKIYKKAEKYLNLLKKGMMFKRVHLDQEFLKKHKIEKSIIFKKWTDDELLDAIERLYKYHLAGYFPGCDPDSDLSKLFKKDLASLIYNQETGSSIFLWVVVEEPKFGRRIENPFPELTKKYFKLAEKINDRKLKNKEERIITSNAIKLIKWHQSMVNKVGKYYPYGFKSFFGDDKNPEVFIDLHIKWLSLKKRMPLFFFGEPYWDDFLLYIKREFSFILDPNKKELKELKEEYRDRTTRLSEYSKNN